MFQRLTAAFACENVGRVKNFVSSVPATWLFLALLVFQNPGVAFADDPPPRWTVPTRQTSDDGYALLAWEPEKGTRNGLFKITETFQKKATVHYTEATDLRAWRVKPGKYEFVLHSCVKKDASPPDCGKPSDTLTLHVSDALTAALLSEEAVETLHSATDGFSSGGPGQLQPGHWYNPAKDGHGWSFYWSNRLALSDSNPLFGNNYDLVGIWYTYEAKHSAVDPDCFFCIPVTSAYRPVTLKLKAVSTGSGSYGGSLYASRNDGGEVWVGSADIVFGSNNSRATITWSVNFKKEHLYGSDPLEFLLGSDPADASNISHFSGLWKPSGDNRYLVVNNIGNIAEVITVIFHDDAGDPTWVQAINAGQATAGSSNFCLAYQYQGYSPQTEPPPGWSQEWYKSGCDPEQAVKSTNRNGRRYFSGLDIEHFWANFTLPGTDFSSGSISIGTSGSPVPLEKAASFHGVSFDAYGGSSCLLTSSAPACDVQLTWFTDGNYPNATVYAHNISNNTYEKVLTSDKAAMIDIPYRISSVGQYEFELRMGIGQHTTLMARSGVFTVIEDTLEAQPETPPAPASPPSMTASSSSSRVGVTTGSFRVAESGSATYNVPILTAPASGGVAPQISLNYDSQSGNGEVGVGWSIGGVSAISLCPQTMEQDGISGSRGIRLDGSDRFCLDGQRLVVDSSTGEYGENGTRYRTEIDSFARITSYGTAGNGPAWFKVERKDGSVAEYGHSSNSRIEARGGANPATAFTWAQNRFQDRYGNYMLYSYLESSSGPVAFVLQAIDYTGNTRAGTAPTARLSFTYRDRGSAEDLVDNYFAGVHMEQRRLLQSIRSQGRIDAGSPLEDLRFYELDYEEDGVGRNILTTLTECRSTSRSICYEPTRFNWLKSESKIDTSATVQSGLLPRSTLSGLLLADVSGDGRPDLLYTKIKNRNGFLYVKEATANAGFSEWATSYRLPNKADGNPPQVFAIDLNSDGIQDVAYSKYRETTGDYSWVALISDGEKFSAEKNLNTGHRYFLNDQNLESRFQVMDFNGDGLSDILHAHTDVLGRNWQLTVLLNITATSDNPALSAPIELDVSNTDLFPFEISGDWGIEIKPPLFEWSAEGVENSEIPDARVFDFNDDGAVDLLLKVWRSYRRCIANCAPQGGAGGSGLDPVYESKFVSFWVLMESNGQNAFTRNSIVALGDGCTLAVICQDAAYHGLPRSDYVWPVDINADGLADLAWGDTSRNWYFQLNTGNGFTPAKLIAQVPDGINKLVRFEDWNGDSFPDLVYPSRILNAYAKWMINQNHFGREFAAVSNTLVLAGNVGGDEDVDQVENDASIFADFSGDGKVDQLLINNNHNGEILSTSIRKGMNVNGSRDVNPANVITSISNGFDAVTEIVYKPLTDNGVYSRMRDSVNANWGNGSAVYDMIAPIYVVSHVESTAPVYNHPSSKSQVQYHYVGAKLQAGGRGFLGFGEVISYDPQSKIRTNTRYRQDFPFIGMLVDTTRVSNASVSRLKPISNTASLEPDSWGSVSSSTSFPLQVSGTPLSYVLNQWNSKVTTGTSISPYISDSIEVRFTLNGRLDRKELITHIYDGFGNAKSRKVSTYDSDGGFFARETTTNTFTNDVIKWFLGQLQTSKVTYSRAGKPSITRESHFAYDSVIGFLRQEITDPNSIDSRITTDYKLDNFGNRWRTTVTGIGMSPRKNEQKFDPLGRYVDEKINALNQTTQRITIRDVFGNPLEVENIDGVVTIGAADRMGRPFVSFTETGVWTKTIQSGGSGSYCPNETAFRATTTTGGGPTQIYCYDILGRTIRTAKKGFNGSYIYTDQYYDSSGRIARVSEPYYAGNSRNWNVTGYDALGRVTNINSAGGDDLSQYYDERADNTCTAAVARVTLIKNGLNQKNIEVKNAKGEITAVYDNQCGMVSYDYDVVGNLTYVMSAEDHVVRMSYDVAGRKIDMNDPDKGHWQYAYNALGEITRQLDSKNQAVDFSYDKLGRVYNRRELEQVSDLDDLLYITVNREFTVYKTSGYGKGQVSSVTYRNGEAGAELHKKVFSYDGFGRIDMVSTTIDDTEQFVEETTYDQYSRVFQHFDASGDSHGLRYFYSNGYLSKIKEAREGIQGKVYQDILSMDARGNVTTMQLGNRVVASASYDEASGRLINLSAFDGFGVEKQNVDYLFDVLGNLKSRDDRSGFLSSIGEAFKYDSLNRLERVQLTAPQLGITAATTTLSLNYTRDGNINCKSDAGGIGTPDGCYRTTMSNYSYGLNAGPHAVTNAGGVSYSYDDNGNQTSSSHGRNISYTVFDKPESISKGTNRTDFSYGVGNSRYQRKDYEGSELQKSTLYLGTVERVTGNDGSFFKRYLGGVAIATYYPSSGNQHLAYLLKDHIGSIHTVLDSAGGITTRMHFSAFGLRQDSDWQTPLTGLPNTELNNITTRGFTGHEQVDSVGVIHMNGRIYDPKIGRFLQADPIVQAPKNSQSLNRYSYVLNNPLSYTDPSGYFSLKGFFKKWGKVIIAGVASYFTFGAASAWAWGLMPSTAAGVATTGAYVASAAIGGAMAGFVGGAIISGSLNGAVKGAFAGAFMGGVAGYFGNTYSASRIAADSVAGGVSSEIYGQNFKDGLLFGALVSSATYITVRLRAYQMAQSSQFKGQIGESKGYRGITGKLGGERTFEEMWFESGAAKEFADGKPLNWIFENKYLPFKRSMSPLGGYQGGEGMLFGKSYSSGGLLDYVIEGYAGVHDTFNQPFFYTSNGTNRIITGFWQKSVGYAINSTNVLFASAIVLPALVPDYLRHLYFQVKQQ